MNVFEKLRWPVTAFLCVLTFMLFDGRSAQSVTPSLDRVNTGFSVFPASASSVIKLSSVTSGTSQCTSQLTAQGYYEVQTTQTMHCRQGTGDAAVATDKPYFNPVSYYAFVKSATANGYWCCIADSTTGDVYVSPLDF